MISNDDNRYNVCAVANPGNLEDFEETSAQPAGGARAASGLSKQWAFGTDAIFATGTMRRIPVLILCKITHSDLKLCSCPFLF